ncbi:MAG TPA: acetyl-CoA hydrolase/transferase C-terminal domain-containing protein [Ramlibacter sp.]|nr:acetyl-CoA hydrolase/transferase C-terminal domain-containing protein [Ramlibacter sp.]
MQKIALHQLRLADHIRPGDVVGWPQGPGEPLALTEALVAQGAQLGGPSLFYGLSHSPTLQPQLREHFDLRALNGAGTCRRASAIADILPVYVSTIPQLLRQRLLPLDVTLVQVRPLGGGRYTLGVIADFTQAMVQAARVVIALVNPALPLAGADAIVEAPDIDVLVESDERIIDMPDPEPSDTEVAVAQQVASLIPDRATVQLGIGALTAAVARSLRGHRDLGVHSGVVSDLLVDLVEAGVVTNAHKGRDAGKTVTGGLFGTRRLRDFAQASDAVELRSADYTHQLATAAGLQRLHTINSAVEIDLTGQVNAEVAGGRYLGAVGGQVDFVRAGLASPGGRSIIAFASATPDGRQSRIVASLGDRPVTTARAEVDAIVTEHGVAHLRGVGLRERARRLVAIAHPAHRPALEQALGPRLAQEGLT